MQSKAERFYFFSGWAYFKVTHSVEATLIIAGLPGATIIHTVEIREDVDEVAIHFSNIQAVKVSCCPDEKSFIKLLKDHVVEHTQEDYSRGAVRVQHEFEIDNYTFNVVQEG